MIFKPRIILPNTGNRRFKTVNIVTSTAGYQQGEIGTFQEGTNCETVQDSGGLIKGLPTICVPGYSGGGGLPNLPDGFAFIIDAGDSYVVHPDAGTFVIAPI